MSSTQLTQQQGPVNFPTQQLHGGESMNVGAVAIEQQRAVAEAQGQLALAKRFPRDLNAAYAELMEACALPALAAVAFYTLPRGKNSVTGPSIRLAEEIARVYGNFQYGHRELARDDKKSEVEVYAWDMEKNNYSKRQLTVMHVLDTKEGPRKLRDQKDIDDKIANVASKQVRGRILALVPKWLSEAAIEKCRQTLAGNSDMPVAERVRKMTQAFSKFGVTAKHLENNLGHNLDTVTTDELADLVGIFNALKEGAKVSDYFGEAEALEANTATGQALAQAASEGAQQRSTPAKGGSGKGNKPAKQEKAEPQPTPEPEVAQQQTSKIVETNGNTVEETAPENNASSASDAAGNDAPTTDDVAGADDVQGASGASEDIF